jgi:hypothetical protein
MPATFLLRALLVDPLNNALPNVPVRPYALDLTKGQWGPIGEVGFTADQGLVELDITGSPAVAGSHLGAIALRHEDTGVVLAEQWWSYTTGDPVILDYGQVRVWDPSLTTLAERTIAGVPASISDALDDAVTVADLEAQLAAAQVQLASTQTQLSSTEGQLAAMEGQLADALGQIDVLNAELEALQSHSGATSTLEAVVANVGSQLTATQSLLVANGSPFQLGKVSLSLKVVPSSGTDFGLPTMDQLASIGGEALSTLHLDFAQTAPASSPPPDATVPAVHGLTEPAARRQLAALGLGASVVHQAIADDGDVTLAGRVLKQIPAAGAAIAPGHMVTLVLGKALESAS